MINETTDIARFRAERQAHNQDAQVEQTMRWLTAFGGVSLLVYAVLRVPSSAILAGALGSWALYRGNQMCPAGSCGSDSSSTTNVAKGNRGNEAHRSEPSRMRTTDTHIDSVEEASRESFPASDPPSYSGTTAT